MAWCNLTLLQEHWSLVVWLLVSTLLNEWYPNMCTLKNNLFTFSFESFHGLLLWAALLSCCLWLMILIVLRRKKHLLLVSKTPLLLLLLSFKCRDCILSEILLLSMVESCVFRSTPKFLDLIIYQAVVSRCWGLLQSPVTCRSGKARACSTHSCWSSEASWFGDPWSQGPTIMGRHSQIYWKRCRHLSLVLSH